MLEAKTWSVIRAIEIFLILGFSQDSRHTTRKWREPKQNAFAHTISGMGRNFAAHTDKGTHYNVTDFRYRPN